MNARRDGRSMAAALALLLALAGTAVADDIDKTVKAGKDGTVSIENVAGGVVVSGWDRAEVQVTGTLGRRVDGVEVESDEDGDVHIEVEVPDHMHGGGYDADLTVRVPKGARLQVETVSADIRVEGVTGGLELESVSGHVDVEADAAWVEAATVSGAIDVRGKNTRVEAESVSGTVDIRDAGENVAVSTTSGAIEVRGGKYRRVSLESVSGRIVFEGALEKDAEMDVEGFSGPVVLYLPADLDADLEVETFSGSIDSDFGGKERRERYGPGAWLETTAGKGSASIEVSSFSSSVRIEKK